MKLNGAGWGKTKASPQKTRGRWGSDVHRERKQDGGGRGLREEGRPSLFNGHGVSLGEDGGRWQWVRDSANVLDATDRGT